MHIRRRWRRVLAPAAVAVGGFTRRSSLSLSLYSQSACVNACWWRGLILEPEYAPITIVCSPAAAAAPHTRITMFASCWQSLYKYLQGIHILTPHSGVLWMERSSSAQDGCWEWLKHQPSYSAAAGGKICVCFNLTNMNSCTLCFVFLLLLLKSAAWYKMQIFWNCQEARREIQIDRRR